MYYADMTTAVVLTVEKLQPYVPPYGRWHVPADGWDGLQADRAYKHDDVDKPSRQLDKKA
jgi:hypothetical protein